MYMSATVMEGETLNTLEPILSPALYFETKITIRCQLVAIDVLNLHLKKSQLVERFKNSCFGHLLNMKIMSLSGQLLHQLTLRLAKCQKKNELWFSIGQKPTRFSLNEFAIITGLQCGAYPEVPNLTSSRLIDKYFEGKNAITIDDIETQLSNCKDSEDKYKFALLYCLESILVPREKSHSIDIRHFNIVDDLDLFNKYPWGKESFRELIKSFQRDWAKKGKELKEKYAQRKITRKFFTYAIYGFPHALQVWAYEAIPLVASKFAIKESITVPRIIGWDAKLKPSATEIDDVLNSNNLILMPILLPRVNELTQPFFTTMASLGKDRVDEVIDQIIHDLDREDGAFVDNMMEEDGGENLDKINESEAVKVASNENIFLEDVHMSPKNSYLTRDEFETRMIHVEEHFQVENSQLKRTIGKLEEKIDLLVDIMLKKGGEKVRPFSDDCFHHDMEICGSDNEDIEAVIHSTAREIPDSSKTPRSLVYSDDDNFQNPSSPESCEIKFPEGRGHRFRKHSKVYRSPYTCPSKRRKLKDPIDFDPFRPLDRAKANDFCTWIKNYKPGDSVNLVLLEAQRNWFKKILKSKAMLEDEHVDVSLYFIRKRADKYPRSFPQKCAILDSFFSQTMIGQWDNFNNWSDPQSYEFDSTCLSYVFGSSPRLGRKWSECEKLYFPVIIDNRHWISCQVDFSKWLLTIYDSDIPCILDESTYLKMECLSKMLPYLIQQSQEFIERSNFGVQPFSVTRQVEVPQTKFSGNCGIFAIKHIEFLSAGLTLEKVTDEQIAFFRAEMATEIFALDFDP